MKRDRIISIKLSELEKKEIEKQSRERGLSVSRYIRDEVLFKEKDILGKKIDVLIEKNNQIASLLVNEKENEKRLIKHLFQSVFHIKFVITKLLTLNIIGFQEKISKEKSFSLPTESDLIKYVDLKTEEVLGR